MFFYFYRRIIFNDDDFANTYIIKAKFEAKDTKSVYFVICKSVKEEYQELKDLSLKDNEFTSLKDEIKNIND